MLDHIRQATPEEIEAVRESSNLTPMSKVVAMGEIRGVWRVAHEIDPVHFNGAPITKVYKFLWGMENILKGAGVTEWYFNTPADDTEYGKVLEHLGAKRISKQPDYRWRMDI